MAIGNVIVQVAGMPAVKRHVERLENEIDELRNLLQQWEPRVRCQQCGARYAHEACGPSHATIAAMVRPAEVQ